MTRHNSVVLLVVLLLFFPLTALAQQHPDLETGFKPYGSYHGGEIDSVSLTNGDLTIQIPIASFPQRGMGGPITYSVFLTGKHWRIQEMQDANGGSYRHWAWRYDDEMPKPINDLRVVVMRGGTRSYGSNNWGWIGPPREEFTVVTGDGTPHVLSSGSGTGLHGALDTSGLLLIDPNPQPVFDGSEDERQDSLPMDELPYTLVDRRGLRYTIPPPHRPLLYRGPVPDTPSAGPCWAPQAPQTGQLAALCGRDGLVVDKVLLGPAQVVDPNGNTVTFPQVAGQTITDTLGRPLPSTHVATDLAECPVGATGASRLDFPAYGGGTSSVKFCYKAFDFQSSFEWTDISHVLESGVIHSGGLVGVVLPNHTKWQFDYNGTGDLINVTFPTGGTITYGWVTKGFCGSIGRAVHTRTVDVNDGTGPKTWTYDWTVAFTDSSFTHKVTDPDGNISTHLISQLPGGACPTHESRTEYIEHTTFGDITKKVIETGYNSRSVGVVPDVTPSWTKTTWQDGRVTRSNFVYDPQWLGNRLQQLDYNDDGVTLLRNTVTSYKAFQDSAYMGVRLLDLPDEQVVYSAATSPTDTSCGTGCVAKTKYLYDSTALTSTSLENHTSAPNGSIRGNLTQVQRWLNSPNSNISTSTNIYYDTGMLQSTKDAGLHETTFEYDPSGTYVIKTTNELSQTTQATYDFNTGLVTSISDQNHKVTQYDWDLMSRLTSVTYPVTEAGTGQVTFDYNDVARTSERLQQIDGQATRDEKAYFDGLGRLFKTQLVSDPDGTTTTDTSYDSLGRVRCVSNPYRANSPDSVKGSTCTAYDVLGRVTKVTQQDNGLVTTDYTGLCATVMDEAGKTRKSCSDALGRLTSVWEDPNGLNYETDYQYDTLGNLIRVDQKGGESSGNWRTRTFNYDSLSRLRCAANPEVGTGDTIASCPAAVSTTYTPGTTAYTYDIDGNLISKTSPKPNQTSSATVTTTFTYDNLHRLTGKSYNDGSTPSVTYGYDGLTPQGCTPPTLPSGTNTPIGRRTAMCDASGASAWRYDEMGRVLDETRTIAVSANPAITKTTSYKYNLDGSLKQLTYPHASAETNPFAVDYGYSSAGRAVSAAYLDIDPARSEYFASNVHYAAHGAVSSISYGAVNGYSQGIVGKFSFNKRLQPLQMVHTTGAVPDDSAMEQSACPDAGSIGSAQHLIYGFNFGAGNNGNVQQITNCRHQAESQQFTYDPLNRLLTAQTATSTLWGNLYRYDPFGNLTNMDEIPASGKPAGQSLQAGSANLRNRLGGYNYDAAGNLTGPLNPLPDYLLSYDAENRLLDIGLSTGPPNRYVYDGDGKRVRKPGTLYWTGSGSDALLETNEAGEPVSYYIFFNAKRIARKDAPPSGQ